MFLVIAKGHLHSARHYECKLPLRATVVPNEFKELLSRSLLGGLREGTLGEAGTFGTIDFMTTDAHEINFHVIDVKWDFSNSLGCIGMEIYLSGTANPP